MRRIVAVLSLVACVACGINDEVGSGQFKLSPVGDAITVSEGESTFILLVAMNAAGAVTFSSTDLPVFASLSGNKLGLHPQRLQHEGQYTFTITATDGASTDSTSVTVQVERHNSPPEHSFAGFYGLDFVCHNEVSTEYPGFDCEAPYFGGGIIDREHDAARYEVEVIPVGGTFTGVPTHVGSAQANYSSDYHYQSRVCVSLTGLTAGQEYRMRYRVAEPNGLANQWYQACDRFTLAEESTR